MINTLSMIILLQIKVIIKWLFTEFPDQIMNINNKTIHFYMHFLYLHEFLINQKLYFNLWLLIWTGAGDDDGGGGSSDKEDKDLSSYCAGCFNVIDEDEFVQALSQDWHIDCFR